MKLLSTTPVFLVADIAATMRWYQTNLQFDGRAVPESPPHTFGIMSKDDSQIFLQQLEGYEKPDPYENREGGVWNVYVQMEGVREFFETCRRSATSRWSSDSDGSRTARSSSPSRIPTATCSFSRSAPEEVP